MQNLENDLYSESMTRHAQCSERGTEPLNINIPLSRMNGHKSSLKVTTKVTKHQGAAAEMLPSQNTLFGSRSKRGIHKGLSQKVFVASDRCNSGI